MVGTPTTPAPVTKPQATYVGNPPDVKGCYFSTLNAITIGWSFAVTNANGIGATILRVEKNLYYGGNKFAGISWLTTGTCRIEGNSSYTWTGADNYYWPGYRYDRAQVMIYVKDDNGYDVTITNNTPVAITWMQ